jgi:hypothetical protein
MIAVSLFAFLPSTQRRKAQRGKTPGAVGVALSQDDSAVALFGGHASD